MAVRVVATSVDASGQQLEGSSAVACEHHPLAKIRRAGYACYWAG
jgi:hypothetical protein